MKIIIKNGRQTEELFFDETGYDVEYPDVIYLTNVDYDEIEKEAEGEFCVLFDGFQAFRFTTDDIIVIDGTEEEKEFFKEFFGW